MRAPALIEYAVVIVVTFYSSSFIGYFDVLLVRGFLPRVSEPEPLLFVNPRIGALLILEPVYAFGYGHVSSDQPPVVKYCHR